MFIRWSDLQVGDRIKWNKEFLHKHHFQTVYYKTAFTISFIEFTGHQEEFIHMLLDPDDASAGQYSLQIVRDTGRHGGDPTGPTPIYAIALAPDESDDEFDYEYLDGAVD